jgi:hypothetical protein
MARNTIDLTTMREVTFTDLASFRKAAKAQGYDFRENTKARAAVRPYYLAYKDKTLVGAFSVRYPKDGYLLVK